MVEEQQRYKLVCVCVQLQRLHCVTQAAVLSAAYHALLCNSGARGGIVTGSAHLSPNTRKELSQEINLPKSW